MDSFCSPELPSPLYPDGIWISSDDESIAERSAPAGGVFPVAIAEIETDTESDDDTYTTEDEWTSTDIEADSAEVELE